MSASDIQAGRAYVELYTRNSPLTQGLRAAQQSVTQFTTALAAAGPAIAGLMAPAAAAIASVSAAAVASVREFANVGSELNDVAARTGLAAGQLQTLKFAAAQTGATLKDVELAARAMAKNGFDVSQFETIAQRIASIEDPSQRAAAAMEAGRRPANWRTA